MIGRVAADVVQSILELVNFFLLVASESISTEGYDSNLTPMLVSTENFLLGPLRNIHPQVETNTVLLSELLHYMSFDEESNARLFE